MNRKEIRQVITKFRISNGNIIVIRGDPTDAATTAYADEFVYQLQQSKLKDVFVVVLDDPSKIAVYDIATMNKHGWFRKEQITSLIRKVTKEDTGAKHA